jgi:pilus assembly protein CpaF
MRLGDRFREAGLVEDASPASGAEPPATPEAVAAPPPVPIAPRPAKPRIKAKDESAATVVPGDPLVNVKRKARDALYQRLGSKLYDSTLSREQLHDAVVRELDALLIEADVPLDNHERGALVNAVKDDILGYGPIERFLKDPEVSEVMVHSDRAIYLERGGLLHKSDSRFMSQEHLRQVIERIVSQVGRRIDESSPMVDARLLDGSRVNAIIPPLAVDGPQLTIRKFAKEALTVEDLIRFRSMDRRAAEFLEGCVVGHLNCLIAGGTGTGKTTMLNLLSSFIPERERIVTIEDAVELQLRQEHVIRLETRPANMEGRGEIGIRELVKNALRMRPDRVVVGECRGGEALDMLQAMNTGHDGSLTTLHANSSRDAVARLETMVLMAGYDLPVRAIREQIASAVDLIIHISRLKDGTRRVTSIDEVTGMADDRVSLNNLFAFDYEAGFDDDGKYAGTIKPTGVRPEFTDRLAMHGITLSAELFGDGVPSASRRR